MATSAERKITIAFAGDVDGTQEIDAEKNAVSPARIQIITLASGDNDITLPSGTTQTPSCCTIMKPGDNTTAIYLKSGVDGGARIFRLHDTGPDSISLHSTNDGVNKFILEAAAQIIGIRLFWS
jgi:hypothetical protein